MYANFLQVLKGLHANGHVLGAIRPEKILIHPDVYLTWPQVWPTA